MSQRKIRKIVNQVKTANLKYKLIENGDRVAVAMSGGKDSFTLLYFLSLLPRYTPLRFSLVPIYIDLGWGNDVNTIRDYCASFNLSLIMESTNIGEIVFNVRQEDHPCSLCANMRRGALNRVAKAHGCDKVALGHHLDDVVTTLFMSMLYEGRYKVFKPSTYLDRVDITVIRPLIYVEERDILLFMQSQNISPVKNLCPADGTTKRTKVAGLIDQIELDYPYAKRRILSSLEKADAGSFWGNA